MLPKLQNTQQSPALGLCRVPQPRQVQKNMQASVGIVSTLALPQAGQVSVLSRTSFTAFESTPGNRRW